MFGSRTRKTWRSSTGPPSTTGWTWSSEYKNDPKQPHQKPFCLGSCSIKWVVYVFSFIQQGNLLVCSIMIFKSAMVCFVCLVLRSSPRKTPVDIPGANVSAQCVSCVCRYYISKGAIVDQLGGDLNSTPLHWATRYPTSALQVFSSSSVYQPLQLISACLLSQAASAELSILILNYW